ncbi:HTH-type transcriptional regulator LysM [uncultured archaeon]|nr:HTH-type transcriptional regulator LysM [uncultured archaeon]
MDGIDKKIVEILSGDAREPFLSIARTLGVSEGTIRQRVSKMCKKGIIKKFTIDTSSSTNAVVEVVTSSSSPTHKIVEKIAKLGVYRVFEVTGRLSIIVIIHAPDIKELNNKLEAIRALEGVMQTETFSVLREY